MTDITAAINLAKDGDVVLVPAGTASWTSPLVVTKSITIQGATTTDPSLYNFGSGMNTSAAYHDQTIILDDVPRTTATYGGALVKADLTPTKTFRLTGFTFRAGTVTDNGNNGAIRLNGTCPAIRIDHCHFSKLLQSNCIHSFGWLYGVIDHCVFDLTGNRFSILVWHDTWGGYTNGEGSWHDPSNWGSEKFMFIEDNILNNTATVQTGGTIDAKQGGRCVIRHNKFNNVGVYTHGTEYNVETGVRAVEVYNNSINWTMGSINAQLRSGTALVHDNNYFGVQPGGSMALASFRQFYYFNTWGGANGKNPWDSNDSAGMYVSGKHTGANSSQKLVVANAGWTAGQWVGYQLINTSRGPDPGTNFNSFITSNTSDTITYELNNSFGPFMTFNTGEGFAIYKVLTSLDQPGRGQRNLIARDSQGKPLSPAWPNQALDPVYSWNNKWNGQNMNVASKYPTIREGRDYYNNTPKPGYIPYTYPHPLTGPAPPSNLSIVSVP